MSEAKYRKRLAENRFQKKSLVALRTLRVAFTKGSVTYGPLVFIVRSGTTFDNCIYCPP